MADGGISGEGIVQSIRLMLDPETAARVEQEIQSALARGTDPAKPKEHLSAVEKGLDKLKEMAKELALELAAAFAVEKMLEFFKSTVEEALSAREVTSRLANTVNMVGISYKDAKEDVERLAKAMDLQGVSEKQTQAALSDLITITGDYHKSLSAVQVAADLAVKRHLDLETATMLVGRAMIGHTETLVRYGIQIDKGKDALAQIAAQTHGAAAAQDPLVLGTKRVTAAWEEFKEEVGDALMGGGAGGFLQTLITLIHNVTDAVREHPQALETAGQAFVGLARGGLAILAGAYSGVLEAIRLLILGYEGLERADAFLSQDALGGDTPQSKALRQRADELGRLADQYKKAADGAAALAATAAGFGTTEAAPKRGGEVLGNLKPTHAVDPSEAAKEDEAFKRLIQETQFVGTRQKALDELWVVEHKLNAELASGTLDRDKRIKVELQLQQIQAAREAVERDALKSAEAMTKLDSMRAAGLAKLAEMEKSLVERLNATNLTETERLRLEGELQQVRDARASAEKDRVDLAERMTKTDDMRIDGVTQLIALEAELKKKLDDTNLTTRQRLETEEELKKVRDDLKNIDPVTALASDAKQFFTDTISGARSMSDAFKRVQGDAQLVSNITKVMAKGQAKAVLTEIAGMAKGKALENLAWAAEDFAHALAASANPITEAFAGAYTAAGEGHLTAAAEWGVAGGAAGLAGGGGGGARGGGSGGRSVGGAAAASATPSGPVINFHVDLFDPRNEAHLDAFTRMQREAEIAYGAKVSVVSTGGR